MSNSLLRTALAVLVLTPLAASAQSVATCPNLAGNSELRWERLDGPGFMFCRALRGDGSEAFAVTISASSPFKPNRRQRAEPASIAGQESHWYRSEIAGQDVIARETLVDVDGDTVAHISLRAADEAQKAQAMQQVQALRFQDARLSSN